MCAVWCLKASSLCGFGGSVSRMSRSELQTHGPPGMWTSTVEAGVRPGDEARCGRAGAGLSPRTALVSRLFGPASEQPASLWAQLQLTRLLPFLTRPAPRGDGSRVPPSPQPGGQGRPCPSPAHRQVVPAHTFPVGVKAFRGQMCGRRGRSGQVPGTVGCSPARGAGSLGSPGLTASAQGFPQVRPACWPPVP